MMDSAVRWQGGGCGNDNSIDSGGNVVTLVAIAGVRRYDESGRGGGGRGDDSSGNVVAQRAGGG
jgi:hypothetical protein